MDRNFRMNSRSEQLSWRLRRSEWDWENIWGNLKCRNHEDDKEAPQEDEKRDAERQKIKNKNKTFPGGRTTSSGCQKETSTYEL
jgi:hypothetical protein